LRNCWINIFYCSSKLTPLWISKKENYENNFFYIKGRFLDSYIVQCAQFKLFSSFCLKDYVWYFITFSLDSFQDMLMPDFQFPHHLVQDSISAQGILAPPISSSDHLHWLQLRSECLQYYGLMFYHYCCFLWLGKPSHSLQTPTPHSSLL